jgi:putative membrane protein insertion efficiency factor
MERRRLVRARGRRAAALVLVLTLGACAVDLSRTPDAQWSTRAALAMVHGYQRTVSRELPRFGVRCRFEPTCSRYAEAVLQRYGLPRGGLLTLRRLTRCGPWTPQGTVDLPP